MAGAGTITKLGPSVLATIAAAPSYFQFDLQVDGVAKRLKFDSYDTAYVAHYSAITHGFTPSEIIAVHKLA